MQCRSENDHQSSASGPVIEPTNLVSQIASLHAQIRADVLVNGPSKFIVQLSSDEAHRQGSYGDDDRDGDQEGFGGRPNRGIHGIGEMRIEAG